LDFEFVLAAGFFFAFISTALITSLDPARTENDFGIGVQGIGHFSRYN